MSAEHAAKTSSLPLLWEYPPEGITVKGNLFFVGSSREHANRRGTTLDQLGRLAGCDPLAWFSRESDHFILEDLGRARDDTVIAGAVAHAQTLEHGGIDMHLDAACVRQDEDFDYRGQGLANYVVGRLLSTMLLHVPAERFSIPRPLITDLELQRTLMLKGFQEQDDGTLSLLLPGRVIPPYITTPPQDELEAGIQQREWSGIACGRVYRKGKFMGEISYTCPDGDSESLNPRRHLIITGPDGEQIDKWATKNFGFDVANINLEYSGAVRLLNSPIASPGIY